MTRKTRNVRIHLVAALGVAAFAYSAAAPAQIPSTGSGQAYPSKPVEFVVHVNPGGGTDVFARYVTEIMTRDKIVTQPLVVLNRPGGAGVVAFT